MYTKEKMGTKPLTKPTPSIFYIKDIVNSINEFVKEDNKLLDCNKYLNDLKLRYYKLTHKYSLQYYNDINFRNLIHSKLTNPSLQLGLNFYKCRGTARCAPTAFHQGGPS